MKSRKLMVGRESTSNEEPPMGQNNNRIDSRAPKKPKKGGETRWTQRAQNRGEWRKLWRPSACNFSFLLLSYVGERPWWLIQSPKKGRKKKANG